MGAIDFVQTIFYMAWNCFLSVQVVHHLCCVISHLRKLIHVSRETIAQALLVRLLSAELFQTRRPVLTEIDRFRETGDAVRKEVGSTD